MKLRSVVGGSVLSSAFLCSGAFCSGALVTGCSGSSASVDLTQGQEGRAAQDAGHRAKGKDAGPGAVADDTVDDDSMVDAGSEEDTDFVSDGGFTSVLDGSFDPPSSDAAAVGLRPVFPQTVLAARRPPAISGGTLLVLRDGQTAIAADPDRDAIYVVDLAQASLRGTITLVAGDEPGRVAEGADGTVHVALRGGGALVDLDPKTATLVARRDVCPAPRGVAVDAAHARVWVACATGELVALSDHGEAALRFVIERDLRDVFVEAGGGLAVTTFRSATLLHVDATTGTVTSRVRPTQLNPHVAWRTVVDPHGGYLMLHQDHSTETIAVEGAPGAYGAFKNPIVKAAVSCLGGQTSVSMPELVGGPRVDIAVSPDGRHVAYAVAGAAFSGFATASVEGYPQEAVDVDAMPPFLAGPSLESSDEVIAVAFATNDTVVAQVREPAKLVFATIGVTTTISLASTSVADTGHAIFHAQAGGGIACMSCHPEGADDGNVWHFKDDVGSPERRTPSLRGTIAGTAPYHWHGDQTTFGALLGDVYVNRMSGQKLAGDQEVALQGWVEALPAPKAPSWVDAGAAARGKVHFENPDVGCASCHASAKLTDNETVDVGTGGSFQVPSLVGLGWHAPFLHDGCAGTLAARFGVCATRAHGATSSLSAGDIADLTAYLESL